MSGSYSYPGLGATPARAGADAHGLCAAGSLTDAETHLNRDQVPEHHKEAGFLQVFAEGALTVMSFFLTQSMFVSDLKV